ncbi:PfkB family carbohydrate kinase [Deinococcus koreensis]|uniref:PfkB family carbohydrate kinase n=1 Tax=Deinococcus koreensis TaxID=2054903 RepID=UPI0013FE2100|nr:PfkB family carbohydrate kinase [Deinococcus koreensis]
MTPKSGTVIVLGSLNLDVLLRVPHLPRAGETMHSRGLDFVPGGKGANQAAACSALGTRTRMIGAVGADDGGTLLRAALRERGVEVSGVRTIPDSASGQAYIHVAPDGENTITLHGGANQALGEAELGALDAALAGSRVLLLQLEVPLQVNLQAAQRARAAGVTVILDPAPAVPELPREFLACVDVLTPNEHEAQTLTGEADPLAGARALRRLGVPAVIVKRGSQSTLLLQGDRVQEFPVSAVQVVSTVAAGDTFNGALASALAAGQSLLEATAFAVQAASLRVSRPPGYGHLPTGAEVGGSC